METLFAVKKSPEMEYLWKFLTSDQVTKASKGKIPKMTREQAAGQLGSWVVETGKANLTGLDVVEKGSGAGRGLSQYTGTRRVAYDKARSASLARGENPNSAQWQARYFAQEYVGQHDIGGRSNIGWTRIFENAPAKGSPAFFADYFTGSEAEKRGYFRPGDPHLKSRQNAAEQVLKLFSQPAQAQAAPPQPKPAATASRPGWLDQLKIPSLGTLF
jgi:hypothetical protein